MHKVVIRTRENEFCALEVTLENDRLSICGVAGDIVSKKQAKTMAIEYWESFFEDNPEELKSMNKRQGTSFRSARSAAQYVLDADGEYHGLDVYKEEGDKVFLSHSFGQIRKELLEFFPEIEPYLKWHLNDMQSNCIHQEAIGITYDKDPTHVCGECGYKIGTAWLKRDLPEDVIAWVKGL